MDTLVLKTQQWLNTTYGNDNRFNVVTENGITGWETIYGLRRALQIELGITETSNNFGPTTIALFNSTYPNGVIQQDDNDSSEDNIYAIIQGGLFCKGYSTGVMNITRHFYNGTGNAIKNLKQDAGINYSSSTVTLNIMKALLSMDYFTSYDTSERTIKTQAIQRYLNANYEAYIGLIPCDGIYGRGTNKAIIFAIQCEEGMSTSMANGNFGDNTRRCLPNLPYSGGYMKNNELWGVHYGDWQNYTTTQINKFITLMNMALYFNEVGDGTISSTINSSNIEEFQEKYAINETGTVDFTTWCSLLVSCGDVERIAIACDTAKIINENTINVLVNNNYDYIGRYLSGTAGGESKALTTNELQLIFSNGIRVFPIYQEGGTSISHFTISNANTDAANAVTAADNLNLQFGSIIYFAVDFDATDSQITSTIIPYFQQLHDKFLDLCGGRYRIGVYGTRNLCKRICNLGYACSSFISDMSSGYSGNLGFCIPENWAFDQFKNLDISYGGYTLEIDKDGFSGEYQGISQEYSNSNNDTTVNSGSSKRILFNNASAIPVYKNKIYVGTPGPDGERDFIYDIDGGIIGYIRQNDFYIRYQVNEPWCDNVHKVIFNDDTDVKVGYIREQYVKANSALPATNPDSIACQILPGQEYFACVEFDPTTNSHNVIPYSSGDRIFTINKPVPYFSSPNGVYEGMLEVGDKIKIAHANKITGVGTTKPWCYRVSAIKRVNDSDFGSWTKYVSVGIEYSSTGSKRAWY